MVEYDFCPCYHKSFPLCEWTEKRLLIYFVCVNHSDTNNELQKVSYRGFSGNAVSQLDSCIFGFGLLSAFLCGVSKVFMADVIDFCAMNEGKAAMWESGKILLICLSQRLHTDRKCVPINILFQFSRVNINHKELYLCWAKCLSSLFATLIYCQ